MMSSVDQRRAWETLWTYDSGDLLEVRQGGGGGIYYAHTCRQNSKKIQQGYSEFTATEGAFSWGERFLYV